MILTWLLNVLGTKMIFLKLSFPTMVAECPLGNDDAFEFEYS